MGRCRSAMVTRQRQGVLTTGAGTHGENNLLFLTWIQFDDHLQRGTRIQTCSGTSEKRGGRQRRRITGTPSTPKKFAAVAGPAGRPSTGTSKGAAT